MPTSKITPSWMKEKSASAANVAGRDWFVNYELDEAMALDCKQWKPAFDELDDMVVRFIEEGYKVQLSYDERNSCHAAYCFVVGENTPNKGLILTGRGSTPIKALRQLLFKHYKALSGIWPRPISEKQRKEWDD